jgi:hypothetical protein
LSREPRTHVGWGEEGSLYGAITHPCVKAENVDRYADVIELLSPRLDGRRYSSLDDGERRREVVALAAELRYSDLLCGV